MIDEIEKDAETRMGKSIIALGEAFKKIRTGRANPALLESVQVSYYGADTPLSQVASITVEEGRTLLVKPWEKQLIPAIEKAILSADLGLNPNTAGEVIRVPMPPLTEETRRDLVRQVRQEAENGKISLRNIRRDANNDLKYLLKEKEISEDEERRGGDRIQKITDQFVAQMDKLLSEKEADLMEV